MGGAAAARIHFTALRAAGRFAPAALLFGKPLIHHRTAVTGPTDGSPVYVRKPQSAGISSMLVQPKYGNKAVFKYVSHCR
jgi:hypothetical protein